MSNVHIKHMTLAAAVVVILTLAAFFIAYRHVSRSHDVTNPAGAANAAEKIANDEVKNATGGGNTDPSAPANPSSDSHK
ncbi:hypothetical protein [Dyella sp. GSA-30]|uniref:hypothetical protein n=1 Tax=Dyella sp. GSA-30 TaxID=2994496 RepID=UPI002491B035|nr:hypothetical protein [Dyella sp. GSA-30]BDU18620.1 hypothetical protein DYGSA30_00770 [Dyella sp. GSA-30]